MMRPWSEPSRPFLVSLAILLALAHALLAWSATSSKSMTADEIAHLTAGLAYNARGDFRLQPENGNLPQRWAALPLTWAETPLPPRPLAWQRADVWRYGHALFFEQGASADTLLFSGRGMIALFSAALGLLVFFWSRALFGWRGAFLSLTLYAFSPSFLAHGALATSDVVMAFFFLASVGAWWRHLEKPGAAWTTISALTLALACVSKFSAVLLFPMLAGCTVLWLVTSSPPDGYGRPLRRVLRTSVVHGVAVFGTLWLFYGFRYSAFAPGEAPGSTFYLGDWDWLLADIGWTRPWFETARRLHVLPEAFLYGFAFVLQFARERAAFLNGEYSFTGWVSFFPVAFLIKSTLPFLLLLVGGLASAAAVTARRIRQAGLAAAGGSLRPLLPLAVLFAVYWATSLASHLNIGHRHILPTYPVLFIAAGWLGRWLDFRKPFIAVAILAATAWHGAESVRVRPHYLAYFNQLVGGPQNGWRHLVDSSLDWGQDLPGLKRWLDAEAKGERTYLAYFGTGDPAYEGIRALPLPSMPDLGPARPWYALEPGTYAVSATMLQHVYSKIRGDWTLELEKEFQQLRTNESALLAFHRDPTARTRLPRDAADENASAAWKRYELLRFARLCHYLRARKPDAMIGYSILIFRLDAAEIRSTTAGPFSEWRRAIEQAGAAGITGRSR